MPPTLRGRPSPPLIQRPAAGILIQLTNHRNARGQLGYWGQSSASQDVAADTRERGHGRTERRAGARLSLGTLTFPHSGHPRSGSHVADQPADLSITALNRERSLMPRSARCSEVLRGYGSVSRMSLCGHSWPRTRESMSSELLTQ